MSQQTYFSTLHHTFSSTRTLAVMLWLLSVLPMASSINVPPPLPARYAEVLVCLFIPMGVFGFYAWFASVCMVLLSIFDALKMDEEERPSRKRRRILGVLIGVLTSIVSVFGIYQNARTVQECSNHNEFGAICGVVILSLIGSGFSALGGILVVFEKIHAGWGGGKVAIPLFVIFLVLQYLSGPVYLGSVVISAHIPNIPSQWDKVKVGALYVALLPYAVVEVVALAAGSKGGLWVVLLLNVLSLTFLFYGVGTVILGKIVGDPWGGYFLQK
ncbi:hypothetical protein K440DRAFT_641519 [Wilcoxina mikolae CBS 423.85]|nr:hypothetical protein K440DRAFT_641519 [Wilcoxina mikolae CBS 423.85]